MEFDIATAIKDFGFPVVAAMGLGYFIYYIWKWVTETIDPILGETQFTLIKLVDRVRMLDNDLIRLNMKLSMVLEYRGMLEQSGMPKKDIEELDDIINKYQSKSAVFNSTGKAAPKPAEPKKN